MLLGCDVLETAGSPQVSMCSEHRHTEEPQIS